MICSNCTENKPPEEFDWKDRARGKRSSKCIPCRREYSKLHYQQNKADYVARAVSNNPKYYERNNAFVAELRKTLKCNRCPEDHPGALDFHHPDPTTKEFNVMEIVTSSRSLAKIQAEINKCEVLCANCHRKHHWNERRASVPQLEEGLVSKTSYV